MPKFLIEHADEKEGCVKALRAIEQRGSHLITKADWGCLDGTHSGYFIAEMESRDAARQVIPPEFRPGAKIVQLNTFTREQIRSLVLDSDK